MDRQENEDRLRSAGLCRATRSRCWRVFTSTCFAVQHEAIRKIALPTSTMLALLLGIDDVTTGPYSGELLVTADDKLGTTRIWQHLEHVRDVAVPGKLLRELFHSPLI